MAFYYCVNCGAAISSNSEPLCASCKKEDSKIKPFFKEETKKDYKRVCSCCGAEWPFERHAGWCNYLNTK